MTSRRAGVSEPTRHSGNALRLGTVIRLFLPDQNSEAQMMISAILAKDDGKDDNLYALLTPHSYFVAPTEEVRCDLMRGRGQPRLKLGTLILASDLLGEGSNKLGFVVVRLEKTPLFQDLRSVAKPMATVKNFRAGIWGAGAFKVRRLNDLSGLEPVGAKHGNRRIFRSNRKGRISGDIEDVAIPDRNAILEYAYCGLVTRGRDRPLGEARALGAPVISQSGALSAIIVGEAENETLVYPVEELRKGRSIDFVTFGDDWPKVKVTPSGRKSIRRAG